MNADASVRVVLEVFAAIEQRDAARFLALIDPEVRICWPPSLPWNDGIPGRPDQAGYHARSWLEVWTPLLPTRADRQMDPEVIAAAGDRVGCAGTSGDAAPPDRALTARCWACTRSGGAAGPRPDILFRH